MDPALAKVLHIEAHRNSPGWVAREWEAELRPVLEPAAGRRLLEAYANLGAGEIAWVTYHPASGTAFFVDDRLVLRDPSPELMNAFLRRWIGEENVISTRLRDALLTAR